MITANEMKKTTEKTNPVIRFIESKVVNDIKEAAEQSKYVMSFSIDDIYKLPSVNYSYNKLSQLIYEYITQFGYSVDYSESTKTVQIEW